MTTINSIVDRLRATGNHGVISYHLGEYCQIVEKRKKQQGDKTLISSWLRLFEAESNHYTMLSGIFWGLQMSGYITKNEQEISINELIAIGH